MPSLLVFRSISTDFTPTPTVPSTSNFLKSAHLSRSPDVKHRGFNERCGGPPTDPLRPINPGNACGFCITAAAGTECAPAYSWGTVTPTLKEQIFFKIIAQSALLFKCGGSSPKKEFYKPKSFFTHAASLGQAFAHCRIFSTAASRRSMARIAVPLLGVALSRPLPVIALVSHYLTN